MAGRTGKPDKFQIGDCKDETFRASTEPDQKRQAPVIESADSRFEAPISLPFPSSFIGLGPIITSPQPPAHSPSGAGDNPSRCFYGRADMHPGKTVLMDAEGQDNASRVGSIPTNAACSPSLYQLTKASEVENSMCSNLVT